MKHGPSSQRGAHSVRRAATRLAVFEATTALLNELGYSAVSTTLISDRAGISRGAIQKQFPLREAIFVDLIAFLAERMDERRTEVVANIADPTELWLTLADFAWAEACSPYAIAFLEIQVAARSHPVLGTLIRPRAIALKAERLERVYALARLVGITDLEAVQTLVVHDLAAVNGLAIELMFTGDREDAERAFARLRENCRQTLIALLPT